MNNQTETAKKITTYLDKGTAELKAGTAYRLHNSGLGEVKMSPFLDPLRGMAAFQDIERRLNFPP